MTERVELSEVAPRDGLQSIGAFVPTETKIALVRATYEAGLRRMEVGSFVSPRAIPQMADTGAVLQAAKQLAGLECTVLVPNRRGLRGGDECRRRPARPVHVGDRKPQQGEPQPHARGELRRPRRHRPRGAGGHEDPLQPVLHLPLPLRGRGAGSATRSTSSSGWWRSTRRWRSRWPIRPAMPAPDQVRRVFEHAHQAWGHRFAFHGHDTYGMGVANVAAAWEAGCRIFDAASGGIGGCPFAPGATGNVAMEDVVWMFRRMGVETGVVWAKLLVAADMAAAVPGATPGGAMRRVPAARLAA